MESIFTEQAFARRKKRRHAPGGAESRFSSAGELVAISNSSTSLISVKYLIVGLASGRPSDRREPAPDYQDLDGTILGNIWDRAVKVDIFPFFGPDYGTTVDPVQQRAFEWSLGDGFYRG